MSEKSAWEKYGKRYTTGNNGKSCPTLKCGFNLLLSVMTQRPT